MSLPLIRLLPVLWRSLTAFGLQPTCDDDLIRFNVWRLFNNAQLRQ